MTSKTKGDFHYLNFVQTLKIENKLKSYEKVCKNTDFCGIQSIHEVR